MLITRNLKNKHFSISKVSSLMTTKFYNLVVYIKKEGVFLDIKEKETIRKILTEEIKKLFNEFNYTKEIKEVDEDTINELFSNIREYAKEKLIMIKYYELIRNINLKLKSEGIDLFLKYYCSCIEMKTGKEIVKNGFVPITQKIQCNECDLKCTDNNIDINKGLIYIKTFFENNKEHYHIIVYCSGGRYLKAVRQSEKNNNRRSKTHELWSWVIRNRDKKCILCGNKEELHAHHIIPIKANTKYIKANPKYKYDTSNGITLCKKCHQKMHRMYKNIEPEMVICNIKTTTKAVTLEDIAEIIKRWSEIVNKIDLGIRMYVKDGIPTIGEDGSLVLVYDDDFPYDAMCTERLQAELRNAIISVIDKDVDFKIKFKE